jgi:hypothetical protein
MSITPTQSTQKADELAQINMYEMMHGKNADLETIRADLEKIDTNHPTMNTEIELQIDELHINMITGTGGLPNQGGILSPQSLMNPNQKV